MMGVVQRRDKPCGSFTGDPGPHPIFMKATLEFNLPEDDEALTDARKGSDWKWAVDDLSSYLRSEIKHSEHTAEEYAILDQVREKLFQILEERELRI